MIVEDLVSYILGISLALLLWVKYAGPVPLIGDLSIQHRNWLLIIAGGLSIINAYNTYSGTRSVYSNVAEYTGLQGGFL